MSFPAWPLYFKGEAAAETAEGSDARLRLVRAATAYLGDGAGHQQQLSNGRTVVSIDYEDAARSASLGGDFGDLLVDSPADVLAAFQVAAHTLLFPEDVPSSVMDSPGSLPSSKRGVAVRVYNHRPVAKMKHVKAHLVGKYVSLRGTVVRVSGVKPVVRRLDFLCGKCSARVAMDLADGRYTVPAACVNPACKSRTFLPDRGSAVTVDWQRVKVQEELGSEQKDLGRIPRSIEVELTEDLVGSATPGDIVTVSGIVKVVGSEDQVAKGLNKTLFLLYVDANAVNISKTVADGQLDLMRLSTRDMYAIQAIANQPRLFRLVVNSLAPSIYGHDLVKAGLMLTLFGGVQGTATGDRNRVNVRGDPHILVVGDPGLGKSQMLQAACALTPRGVYVCGNTTTTSGLTVTVQRDAATGDFALEAGALVLGDQGACCIDEFDKMGTEYHALLEAMEQQSISIAKAGIVCSLPARTSVIAAANPVGGHYNRGRTVSENLKMHPALLSRFDLIFILLDQADEQLDKLLSRHVMAMHAGPHAAAIAERGGGGSPGAPTPHRRRKRRSRADSDASDAASADSASGSGSDSDSDDAGRSLAERLALTPEDRDEFEAIPPSLLRKYIAYARKYVAPTLSTRARQALQEFYLELRRSKTGVDTMPITTRQLEALIRLSQARARCELREVVTRRDALDVIELYQSSMIDTMLDEKGTVDFTRANGGMSKAKEARAFVTAVSNIAERTGCAVFTSTELLAIARDAKLSIVDFDAFLERLNLDGYLLMKGPKLWKLQTVASSISQSWRPHGRSQV